MDGVKLKVTKEDMRMLANLQRKEIVTDINRTTVFEASIYAILSASDSNAKANNIFDALRGNGLLNVSSFVSGNDLTQETVARSRYHNLKYQRLVAFSRFFTESELVRELIADANHNREMEFELRNGLAEQAPGMSLKTASFLMVKLGYTHVVPVDKHMVEFLEDMGYYVHVPDYKKKTGPMGRDYLKYEGIIARIAEEYGLEPAVFQFLVWGIYSRRNGTSSQSILEDFPSPKESCIVDIKRR